VRIDADGVHEAQPFLLLESLYTDAVEATPDRGAIREAVIASVRRHLVADVPVGLFLSSGIDSVAILAAVHAIDPDRARQTTAVTLRFSEYDNSPSDEAPFAAKMAERYRARHVVVTTDEREFREHLPRILEAMDQPSIDGVNSWFVSKAAAGAGLKVVMSGLGGAELFAGYGTFKVMPRWKSMLSLPSCIPGSALVWERLIGSLNRNGRWHPKLAGLMRHGGSWDGIYLLRRGLYLPSELNELVDAEMLEEGLQRLGEHESKECEINRAPNANVPLISQIESSRYMRNQLLRDVDWASMDHSLEVRTPFVDVGLLRAFRPFQSGVSGKAILADALDLPDNVRNRTRTGFTTPIETWMCSLVAEKQNKSEPWARTWARFVVKGYAPVSTIA
jgi:asparagine synthase (glutamine-hydrolysing)